MTTTVDARNATGRVQIATAYEVERIQVLGRGRLTIYAESSDVRFDYHSADGTDAQLTTEYFVIPMGSGYTFEVDPGSRPYVVAVWFAVDDGVLRYDRQSASAG